MVKKYQLYWFITDPADTDLHGTTVARRSGMARTFLGASAWLSVTFACVAWLAGCGDDEPEPGRRFTPGESDIVTKRGAADECEAGVCSPKPAEGSDAPDARPAPKSGPNACDKKSSCAAATDLGVVRGDTGGDTRSRQGVGSEFFTVDVTEAREWYEGPASLRVAFTLISPKSTNYDLFVYEDCAKALGSSAKPAGETDKINASWGEGFFANGVDDRKTLRVEVRKVSQSCDPDDEWTLIVQGNSE
jgi:hypothetical protein